MVTTIFNPSYKSVAQFNPTADAEDILLQQGMYAADYEFAINNSQPLVVDMLESIPQWYRDRAKETGEELNIDIRVHELKQGQFPASPGWHVDAATRETSFDDAADQKEVSYSLVGTISTQREGVSNTIFCDTPITVDSSYERAVDSNCLLLQEYVPENVEITKTQDGYWTLFDPYTVHCVERAQRDGVRAFVRVSLWNPPVGHEPGLTHIEQVYNALPNERDFWL